MTDLLNDNPSIPLWLDIKTEYIDANLPRVIAYLHDGATKNSQDSFYLKTVELLKDRIEQLLDELYGKPLCDVTVDPDENDKYIRLLGLFLLIHKKENGMQQSAFLALLAILQRTNPNYSQNLTELSLDILSGKVKMPILPFGWSDIDKADISADILLHKICNEMQYDRLKPVHRELECEGIFQIEKGSLKVCPLTRKKMKLSDTCSSMELCGERIMFKTLKNEKLKKGDENDIGSIDQFVRNFIMSLGESSKSRPKQKKRYGDGDTFEAKIKSKQGGRVQLASTDRDYETIEGELAKEDSFLYYNSGDFLKHLHVGDCIEVKLLDNGNFGVSSTFIDFVCTEYIKKGEILYGRIFAVKPDKNNVKKMYIWTTWGVPVLAPYNEDYDDGDFVELKVTSIATGGNKGFINVDILGQAEPEPMTEEDTKEECISSFRFEDSTAEEEDDIGSISEYDIHTVYTMLAAGQKTLPSAMERYRNLAAAYMMCHMISRKEDADYVEFLAEYLKNLIYFVKSENNLMTELKPAEMFAEAPSVVRKLKVISILSAYDHPSHSNVLKEAADGDDEMLRKLSALVQSSNSIGGFISKSMKNVIKREITKALSLDSDGESDLDAENGIYLGLENDAQEFKTSFFFAPKNAAEQDQAKTIFKGFCAFLNSRNGGTLYLGVNDLGYVSGLKADIDQMEKKMIYGNYKGIDGLVRYITDKAKTYFDLSILTHINIVPAYDGQVLACKIEPYEYKIVELEKIAYIRLNNESVKMNEATRRIIMNDRIIKAQDKSTLASELQQAINNKRKVVLHNYSSSSGKDIRNRNVEPFAFAAGFDTVWCFDLEDGQNKVFKVDRISSVEITDDCWEYTSMHKSLKMDIFRMSGEKTIKVKLELNMMARNMLIEEYEGADKILTATDDPDKWLLSTDVYRIEGIGRFYIGLANCIRIIKAPELQAYVKEFKTKYLN